jgi:hypothetical protein
LLSKRRRIGTGVPEPLVPLGRDFDFAIMGRGWVLDYPPHSILMGGKGITELPEGVALKVET